MALCELEEYMNNLPDSMGLKKRVIKCIMKSKSALTQKEIKELVEGKKPDWTNLRRVLRDLLDEGLIVKTIIGTKEYYVRVELHRRGKQFIDGDTIYYYDVFEPDCEGEEKYIRIKQTKQIDRDNYEVIGKITMKISKLNDFLKTCNEIKTLVEN